MSNPLHNLPPLVVDGRLIVNITTSANGSAEIALTRSPMMSRDEARDYVGLGVNAFCDRVNDGAIKKRGETNNRPYHIDDLNEYLTNLAN